MTTSTTNCNQGYQTWNCSFTANATDNWSRWYSNPRIKYQLSMQSVLGSGKIAEMALFCEDLELKPECRSNEGIGYLTVSSFSESKINQVNAKAKEMGFTDGEVKPKGKTCKCSTL